MIDMKHEAGIDKFTFKKLKEDALDLLSSALDELSPSDQHKLHLKMGIEREGNFIPTSKDWRYLPKEKKQIENWLKRKGTTFSNIAKKMQEALSHLSTVLERIYHDSSGLFVLELNTRPLPPKEAAQAAVEISNEMLKYAKNSEEIQDAHFGTMLANFANDIPVEGYPDQFYLTEEGRMLAGHGQHANISLWCGNRNLFAKPAGASIEEPSEIAKAVAEKAMETLPGMMLPSRHGDYLRVVGEAKGTPKIVELSHDTARDAAVRWQSGHQKSWQNPMQYARLEFRNASAQADPFDAALAAAIPTTMACMECICKDPQSGKAKLEHNRALIDYVPNADVQASLVPHSQEEAIQLFNTENNPNFTFLNDLAAKKIEQLKNKYDQTKATPDKVLWQQAVDKWDDIGAKLHHAYCKEYGIKSVMPLKAAAVPRVGRGGGG